MCTEKNVFIHSCRCFESDEKLFFGKSSSKIVLIAVLAGRLDLNVGAEAVVLLENMLILKSGEDELSSVGCLQGRTSVFAAVFESKMFSDKPIFNKAIILGKRKRRYLGEIIREMSRADNDSAELLYESGQESFFGEALIIENSLSSLLVRITRDILSDSGDSGEDSEIKSLAQIMRRYLYENYKTKVTLDSLCFLFRTNKTTICKQFREEYGMTVLEYLNSLRIKEAKRLVLEERLSVTEIADDLGFESIHYFTRFFKKMTGYSPTEYVRIIGQRQKFIDN